MKRFNLIEHYDLSESVARATDACIKHQTTVLDLYVCMNELPAKLDRLIADDNGLQASKHIAKELMESVNSFINTRLTKDGNLSQDTLNLQVNGWEYSHIYQKLTAIKTVYLAECRDLEVYSVDQISIYKTSNLVSSASSRISAALYK